MAGISQDEINVDLFDEVKRLKAKLRDIEEHCVSCGLDKRAIQPYEILDIINKN